jgi:hypothetical protein
LRWLGNHQASAYAEYKDVKTRTIPFRDAIVSNHSWLPANLLRAPTGVIGSLQPAPDIARLYQRFYLGDNQGNNVDYAPSTYAFGTYPFVWGNGVTRNFVTEQVTIGGAGTDKVGGNQNTWTELKSSGGVLQSHFFRDRLVTTFGLRRDARYSRTGRSPVFLTGTDFDYDEYNGWADGDWATGKGNTTTAQIVLRPVSWFSVYTNRSNSFQPASIAYSLHRQLLPDPRGSTKDYGIMLNLFSGKLLVRANRYVNKSLGSRNGDSANIAQRMFRLDFPVSSAAYVLQRQAQGWVDELARRNGETLTAAQVNERIAGYMKLPVEYLQNTYRASALDDLEAKGTEIEVNYNPSNYWTMRVNATKTESINTNLAHEITDWLSERRPVWETIIDPILNRPWFTERYNNSASAAENLQSGVITPLQFAQAMEGKSRPEIRKYKVNYLTSYRLAGLTSQKHLARTTVGGAVRWEDKGAIGYWGVQQLPNIITELDPSRPIYDKGHYYADMFVSYRTRLFSDKVATTFQLNVRNVQESGRLQPARADPDGSITAYRIVDPRVFIFTATFSF